MRRVVTYLRDDGTSDVASDSDVTGHAFVTVPGMRETPMWATGATGEIDRSGRDIWNDDLPDLPGPGETRFHIVQFPPDAVYSRPGHDAGSAAEELRTVSPGLAALFEPLSPGVHTTDTVDYVIVLQGGIVLELDNESVTLETGDVVVQNATRHAWRNPYDVAVVLGIVTVGPPRS